MMRDEPDLWQVTESELDVERLGWSESMFALSNGHIGLRGNLDEGEPFGTPGTYLNSVFEFRDLPVAEAAYSTPETGQTVINVTNGKLIRLLVDDEPFDVRYGTLRRHERRLDLRAGLLERDLEWESPAGQAVRVRSTRLVSFSQRAVAAIRYEVEAVDAPARIVVQSELVANEPLPAPRVDDPRVAAVLEAPLIASEHQHRHGTIVLVHRTCRSDIGVAAAMSHEFEGPTGAAHSSDATEDLGRSTFTAVLQPGERLSIVKYLGYGWSTVRSEHALRDQVTAAIVAAADTGWDGLCREQREYLDDFWSIADVEIHGDVELQRAVRFSTFHAMQAAVRAEQRPIPAKGLTGSGYDGHAFWDTESFVLPFLIHTRPDAAADALRWRHSTLQIARQRAMALGLSGAAFPWRTIDGSECSGYWPAGTAAFHVNADIADAVIRYVEATEDQDFEESIGVELLVETARLWRSLGHFDVSGDFRIDGVTGPDEYSAVTDNNVYTNLMARRNLRGAVAACRRHLGAARALSVVDDEMAGWSAAADAMRIPFDERLGVHPQSEGFTDHEVWDFEHTTAEQYPLMKHFPYFDLYRKQVIKQADVVLAMQLCNDSFTPDQRRRNFDYYEQLTVRDSSLTSATQAIVAAHVGHLHLAYDYARESAFMDLRDLHHNTGDGLHIAAHAGSWMVMVVGFGGMRAMGSQLGFSPVLPPQLDRIAFTASYRSRHIEVVIESENTTYRLIEGRPIEIRHHDEAWLLDDEIISCATLIPEPRDEPQPPHGREPMS